MNFDQFISKWAGKKADFDGAYGAQCVDLARFFWKEVCEITQPRAVNGAKDFWTNYETDPALNQNFYKIPNSPTGVPEKGDVIIWGSSYGPYGHIAMFTSGNVDSFKAFSQNDPTGALSNERDYKNYTGVLGWFNPKKDVNGTPESPMTELHTYLGVSNDQEAKAKLKEHLGEKDTKCDWGNSSEDRGGYLGSERRKNDELVRKNGELETKVKSLEEQIRVLNDELENCQGSEEIPEIEGFTANGLQIEMQTNYGKKIINYRKD